MPRIILHSGKGGVGKTTTSAATALACAKYGHRTIVLSFDLAHSLSDSFDIDRDLFDQNKGLPFNVAPNLDIQEIDVQEELERHWGDVYKYFAMLLTSSGVKDVVAEEVAVMPGMEDVICLLYLNQYVKEGKYDVVVVDCPPTSESIRFVSMTSTIEWYMGKRFGMDRNLLKLARPLAKLADYGALPEDSYFEAIKNLFHRIEGVETILINPEITTVRLVTNAEKMVVRETQRAFMYFSMYGLTTDGVVVNRLLPQGDDYFKQWVATQTKHLGEIEEYFQPVPVTKVPLFRDQVVGLKRLEEVGEVLFGKKDPAEIRIKGSTFQFEKKGAKYLLKLPMPFVNKESIDLSRQHDDLFIRIGSFKRHVPLPRAVARLSTEGAVMKNGELHVTFAKEK